MATRTVTIRECDRCGRKEEVDAPPQNDGPPIVEIVSGLHEPVKRSVYTDLCPTCRNSVKSLLDKIFLIRQPKEEGEGE